jgi:thiamine-monophosphate kinase
VGAAATHLQQRFLRPEPRVALGRRLRTIASAAMDVSDGLLGDLTKLCAASNCGAQLDVGLLPASAAMRELFSPDACLDYALAGGDDYEIIFSVSPSQAAALAAKAAEPPLTRIGVMTAGQGVQCTRGGAPFAPRRTGYDHFAHSGQT